MGAFGLPFGLIMTLVTGAELFTGNTALVTGALMEGKTTKKNLIKNWTASYLGNFVGSLILAYQWRPQKGWGWMVFNGALRMVLGIMIYRQFPTSATWLVGLLVGIRLLFAGWTMILLGSATRSVAKAVDSMQAP